MLARHVLQPHGERRPRRHGPRHGALSAEEFSLPGAERKARLGAVVSVDRSVFGGFYANTIAVCLRQSYTAPMGRVLGKLRMSLGGRNFHFKDATRFSPRGEHCYRWPRPGSGFDWSFGDVKKVELFLANAAATGKPRVRERPVRG